MAVKMHDACGKLWEVTAPRDVSYKLRSIEMTRGYYVNWGNLPNGDLFWLDGTRAFAVSHNGNNGITLTEVTHQIVRGNYR